MNHENLQATLILQHVPGVGTAQYWRLVEMFGTPEAVLHQSADTLGQFLKPPSIDALTEYWRNPQTSDLGQRLSKSRAWLDAHPEIHLITLADSLYPPLLREISRPPPLLYVWGNPESLSLPQLAIVGSRNPTAGGKDNARQFAHHLGKSGFVIASGLALGVDGQAHTGALEAEAVTIAVMGTGMDRIYPARHRSLAEAIVQQGGAVVTEFSLGCTAQPSHFPQRNRIISGLSLGTLVVEAASQSGSLITARYALQQNREVFVIPGSIHNPLAKGCHQLIREGATLVETAQDVVQELSGILSYQHSLLPDEGASRKAAPPDFSPEEQVVIDALGHDPQDIDTLAQRSGLDVGRLASLLIGLELKGVIANAATGYVRTLESAAELR